MALGKKTGGRDIQKGQVMNPLGGKAHYPDTRKLRRLTQTEVAEIGTFILEGNEAALETVRHDPKASALKVWFAAIALTAIKRGDPVALDKILDRIVGRPKAHLEVSGALDTNPNKNPEQVDAETILILQRVKARSGRLDP